MSAHIDARERLVFLLAHAPCWKKKLTPREQWMDDVAGVSGTIVAEVVAELDALRDDRDRARSLACRLEQEVEALREQATRFLAAVDYHFDHPIMDFTPVDDEMRARWDERHNSRTALFLALHPDQPAGSLSVPGEPPRRCQAMLGHGGDEPTDWCELRLGHEGEHRWANPDEPWIETPEGVAHREREIALDTFMQEQEAARPASVPEEST